MSLAPQGVQTGKSTGLIQTYEAGVTDYVGRKDSGKPSFDSDLVHYLCTRPKSVRNFMSRCRVCPLDRDFCFGSKNETATAVAALRAGGTWLTSSRLLHWKESPV